MEKKDLRNLQIGKEQVSKIVLLRKGKNLGTYWREAQFAFSCAVQPPLALWTWLSWVERFWGEYSTCVLLPLHPPPHGGTSLLGHDYTLVVHDHMCLDVKRENALRNTGFLWVCHWDICFLLGGQNHSHVICPVLVCSWEQQTSWSLLVISMPSG